MTREQAINSMISHGFTVDQVGEIVKAVTPQFSSELEKNSKKLEKDFGELDCISRADAIKAMQNKAKKLKNEDTINGLCGAVAILYEMPSVTPQLSVSEVTALAEWTEKLTKASEDAYNKGYADGMKALKQEPKNCEDCEIVQGCIEAGIRATQKALEQESRWIPTAERLPKEDGEYLVTIYDMDENHEYMDIAELEDGKWCYKPYILVKAWMPLPKAYREVEE